MIKKLLLFVRLLFLPKLSLFSVDDSRGKLSVTAKIFCFALLFCASFANATTYYSGINGAPTDANNLNNWWLNTNGTGGHPANFTTGGDIFIVQTGHSMATTAAWAVTGSLQIQTGGTLSVAGFDITISGTTSITGSLIHSSNTGTKTYVGLVTVNPTGLWNNSSNTGVIFRGGITNNGTFTSGSGVHTFNTNNQSLTGNFSIPKITVTGVSLTNISTNTLTVATALDGTGNFINQGVLNIAAATVPITTLTATATGNKVNYSGAAQTIKSTSYYDLTFTGSGTKTFGATTVATSNFINVASGVQLDLSANNNHTARVLILGGVGPLTGTWGAQGSGAANTTNTYFTTTLYGRIIVSGTGTFDPVIDSNYASYIKGLNGKVNASYVENAAPTVLTAPNGTVFINADFASYGTPAGTAPNFTIGTCNAFNSRTVATDVFLGNTTATIPATNATFGDPCVSIVKRLSVVATYTEPICTGTSPGLITGSTPTGGNGAYTYLWEVSTTGATTGYAAATGTNNAKDYTPGNLTATSWFRRTVYSGLYASETIVIVQVNTTPVTPTAIANTAFCAGSATTLTVSGGSKGGNGGYAQWYTGSCGGTLIGSGDSVTVTPTAPTTYYVRYQNGCATTTCFSTLIDASVSITAASAATAVCYNASVIQTTPLSYSATTGTPTTYSIAWNAAPTNGFLAVSNAALLASNISINVPAGTNPGVYTGKLTVRNALTCTSFENIFTVTVNSLPTITGTLAVCMGSTTQLTGSPSPNATTPWTSGTPAVATVNSTGLVTPVSAGTSVITYKNSNGCTQTATVTVNSLPTISGTLAVCMGSTTQLTGSPSPDGTTPWTSGTTSVATVSNTGLVTPVSAGTSVITYKNSVGCTQTVTVTVNALPTITGTLAVCMGSTTQLAGSPSPDATTPWTSGTPAVATVNSTGLVTPVSAGTSVITYKNSNGCTQTATVTVNSLPTISGTLTVCIGSATQLTGSPSPDGTTPWTSGTTSVATVSNTGLVSGVAAGTSVITYKNSVGCTQTVTVTVNSLPTITGTLAVCMGSTTQLTGSPSPNATTPWTSGTPAVATVNSTGLVTPVSAGTSVITYKNSNGCTQTATVTVNSLPTISGTLTVCIGSATQLTGSPSPDATTPWTSGTTSVATVSSTGLVSGVAAGTSVITYKNSVGCTQTVTVTVNTLPTITGTLAVCMGSTTQLTGSPSPNATTPWTSGTPAVATVNSTGLVTPVSAGTSVITYKNSNGCTQTATVTVNSLPTISGTLTVCIGSATQLTGSPSPDATTPWTSGTTSVATVSSTGLVSGVAAGTSVITYKNSFGCTQIVTVTVNSLPTITGTLAVCMGSTTQLAGSPSPNATTPWTSGTPAVATVNSTGLVTPVSAGTSVITYKNSFGCTQIVTVTVNSLPTITGTLAVCIGSTTQLTGSPSPDGTTPWTSGTTSVATVSSTGLVSGVAAGTSVITYKNSNGCTQTVTVTVNPQPSAPIVGTITQPTCVVPTGTVVLSGLPSTGTWTLTRSPGAVVTSGTGTGITISGLAPNTTYTYTVGNGTCTSVSSANIPVNQLALLATWNAGWTNGPPTIDQPVVFAGDYTSAGDLNSCSCTVNSGVNVVISAGNTLSVTNGVTVTSGATLTFENNSSLLQDSNVVNTGDITYKRISSMRLSDYEYWSSPVAPQKLFDVSPFTLSDKFMGYNGNNWVITSSNSNMTVGKGYIIRGPQTYSNTVRANFTASFIGVPNNGNLSGETLEKDKFYLIGNPYPSALSANEFLKANNFINGTFYFWTHNTPLNIAVRAYSADDYAVFNLTGGVATEAAPTGDDAPGNNPFIPQGHIGAGQSFFASTNDVGTVAFTNKMREGGTTNGQFFKPGKEAKDAAKSRIWLNMTNEGGAFKQMLVGYIDGATNGIDNRYDGESFDANPYLDFYSVNNDLNYVIQGRALPFTDTDVVPLGYRSKVEGDFTIAIQHTEGDLVNQAVYIEDKTTGIIHNLKNGKYTFTTKAGTFGDRLVLRYTDKTLGTGDFENTENDILVSVKSKAIKVTSAKDNIKEVTVYDVSGKLLYNKKKVGATELQIANLQSANQVLLVKVTLENDYTTVKKVIFQ